MRNKSRGAAVYGIDLGKNLFHVVGTDTEGRPVQKLKFRRDTLLTFYPTHNALRRGEDAGAIGPAGPSPNSGSAGR